ncbi:hypothetical protein DFH28DRAFT_1133388 [Melampsora americana]|nr:hypothetical protein DFH28DRAFT_1133388 [Melampsora americana]
MSGHITLPMSEILHAGYKHDFSPNNTHDFNSILSQYPSNNKINELLELAESRGEELAAFAGMTTKDTITAAPLNNFAFNKAFDELNVSVSIHKQSHLDYPFETETITIEQALETAAGLTSQHQETDVLMSQVTMKLENLALEVPTHHMMQQTTANQLLEQCVTPLTTISEALVKLDGTLLINQMVSKRHAHDSQVQNHHGPEKPRVASKDLPVLQYDPDTGHEFLLPSQYSKAVSFFWSSHKDPEYGEARKHRWKTLGKRKLCELTDKQPDVNVAELDLGFQVQYVDGLHGRPNQSFGMGAITATNPLTKNKWVVVIKQDTCIDEDGNSCPGQFLSHKTQLKHHRADLKDSHDGSQDNLARSRASSPKPETENLEDLLKKQEGFDYEALHVDGRDSSITMMTFLGLFLGWLHLFCGVSAANCQLAQDFILQILEAAQNPLLDDTKDHSLPKDMPGAPWLCSFRKSPKAHKCGKALFELKKLYRSL